MWTDDRRIDDLVSAVAAGRPVDWPILFDACHSEEEHRLIEQLKVLADVAGVAGPV